MTEDDIIGPRTAEENAEVRDGLEHGSTNRSIAVSKKSFSMLLEGFYENATVRVKLVPVSRRRHVIFRFGICSG